MAVQRLSRRALRPWSSEYLHHRYLWPNLARAAATARAAAGVPVPLVVDVGCGHKPYQDLFEPCAYVGVNYSAEGASPDVVGDAIRLPIAARVADIVVATQVIEHVPSPQRLLAECARVLRPGGCLVLSGPFYWPLHEEPHDYFRFTRYGLERLLREVGFREAEIRADGGDVAQAFLSFSLLLEGRALAPVRLVLNLLGAGLDRLVPRARSPANYTVLARLG